MKYAHATAAVLALALLYPVVSHAQEASQFLSTAIKGDNSEIKLGKLAETRGGSTGVRSFGRTLVADHTKARQQALTVAAAMSIQAPEGIMPEARDEYTKLSGMHGADFDHEFADYMVKDHQEDIADFSKEASANQGKASQLAAKQLPTLKKHLRIAERLQKSGSSASNGSTTQP